MLKGLYEKGVGGFFAGDGGGGAVAGIDGGLSGEGQDFFSNTGKQQVTITSGQVPAADAIGKENIPAE